MISRYRDKKDSGLLSVKIEGQEHLLKIYFDLGMIVGLSMGALKNEECLDVLAQCKPVNSAFINGYRSPDSVVADKEGINSKLEGLFGLYPVTGGSTSMASNGTKIMNVLADNVTKLRTDFINIMGPVGKMIIDTLYQEIGYDPGNGMPAEQYSTLIDRLKEAMPAEYQDSFAAKYAIGLALNKNDH